MSEGQLLMPIKPEIEFGVIARVFPNRNVGLIQPNQGEVVYFQGNDRRHLKLNQDLNQIYFGDKHRRSTILKEGTLVVFTRNKYYSRIPGLEQAGKWADYASWAFLHAVQLYSLKRLVKK